MCNPLTNIDLNLNIVRCNIEINYPDFQLYEIPFILFHPDSPVSSNKRAAALLLLLS